MKRKKHNWNNEMARTWQRYKPPIRPSRYELAVFRRFLEQKIKENGKDTMVLILGSTPEFRDIINSKKLTAYICDYNKKNYNSFKLLKKTKGKEVLIKQNWTKLKTDKKFDLVFAEASLNVVKKSEVPKVLANVNNVIKEDGLFLAKTWMRKPKSSLSFKKILSMYRKQSKKYKDCHHFTDLYNLSYLYDVKKDSASLKHMYFKMKELYEKNMLTKKEFNSFCGLAYETTPLEVYLPFKKDLSKIINKKMKLAEIIYTKPVCIDKFPIYVCKKK